MMRLLASGLLLLLLFVAVRHVDAVTPQVADDPLVVQTAKGVVRGELDEHVSDVRVFRGIPYAKPPVGPLRWKAPVAPDAWEGVLDCDTFGPACPQPKQRLVGRAADRFDEDCLYLNVWSKRVADDAALRSVMVWIHGGGFVSGSSSMALYNGSYFAADDVVFVSLNYRLGPFGFFGHPALSEESDAGVSGNYGMLDQIAALRWVQQNIRQFGGDPGNVTIFGESAGSVSVGCLMVMPEAEGLFHKAIMQSGVPTFQTHLNKATPWAASVESQGIAIAESLGLETPSSDDVETAEDLRAIDAAVLLEHAAPSVGIFGKGNRFWPCIDGVHLPDSPMERFASGQSSRVPLIIGSNDDEATMFLSQLPVKRQVGYKLLVRSMWRRRANTILDAFPVSSDDDVRDALVRLVSVLSFNEPARRWARLASESGMPTWMYAYGRPVQRGWGKGMGAMHGAEIPYVFGDMEHDAQQDEVDQRIGRYLHGAWIQFARTGSPDGWESVSWPCFETASDISVRINEVIEAVANYRQAECDVVEANPIEPLASDRSGRARGGRNR